MPHDVARKRCGTGRMPPHIAALACKESLPLSADALRPIQPRRPVGRQNPQHAATVRSIRSVGRY